MNDITEARVHYVRVTNGLDFPFTDRYDGVPVTLPPGKSENLPLDMAAHFFGYHVDVDAATMLRHIARRQGWNTPDFVKQNEETRKTKAEEYFGKLKIEPVMYKLVPADDPDPKRPVPADPEVPTEVRRGPGRPPKPAVEARA
jgi:hypothetical protein